MIAVRIAPRAGMGPSIAGSPVATVADEVVVALQRVREAGGHARVVPLLPQRDDEQLAALAIVAADVHDAWQLLVGDQQRPALDVRAPGGERAAHPGDDLRLDVHGPRARPDALAIALGGMVGHGDEDPF